MFDIRDGIPQNVQNIVFCASNLRQKAKNLRI